MTSTSNVHHLASQTSSARCIELRAAVRRLASIHGGIKGQSIPMEVMDFYKTLKNGDCFRPRMLREVVLGLEAALNAGVFGQQCFRAIVHQRLASAVLRLPIHRLEAWLQADQRRLERVPGASNNRIDRLRVGWLSEAEEMIDDTLLYAASLARTS